MSNLDNNCIVGQKVEQNQQDFVLGVFSIGQILKFTKYTQRLIVSYDEDNKPIYNKEIQREWGLTDAVFIDNKQVRSGPPTSYKKIRRLIEKRVRRFNNNFV